MQLFVSLLVIVIYLGSALIPISQIILDPLLLLALDRIFKLPYLLLHIINRVLDMIDIILQSLYRLLLGSLTSKPLCRARPTQSLRIFQIRQTIMLNSHTVTLLYLLGWRIFTHK